MYELKTKPTDASVRAYLDDIQDEQRRQDCEKLVALMGKVTGEAPKMWGPGIVGFGSYHYQYASGHEGDASLVGFSSRKDSISLYVMPCFSSHGEYLSQLGKHKAGKACLYVKRLSEINLKILEQMIVESVADIRRRYP